MITPRVSGSFSYPVAMREARTAMRAVREIGPAAAPRPRLLDRVRDAIRARHYSRRTEKTYVAWIRRYIFFHGKRHPAEMGAAEITRFLTSLAVEGSDRSMGSRGSWRSCSMAPGFACSSARACA
jgi:Phage integrase, N-terminal SAM-like domain